ncbi:MAG TPA: D-sedoheptulose 7-phosphate isomerase [Methylomusa anaerophila]|uniref:Phosphoheptose isomerase n=1 Tax=Methylomusa anaerophila TaxID=1930071 RepID=A0A348AKK7_9FIRM|nr:D-sedoheptulose 7-phosphate isomerase [Methylomusa anaerophila]BBB91605.1 phosphoheptose isomerase [Methylomusa anaerophila]HML89457.1 D-sedoheptulose 7-phosphate isomerase [Methylomusa anaerophila]
MLVEKIMQDHVIVVEKTRKECLADIETFAGLCKKAVLAGRTVFFCGNGGSAADSQHLAAEFVGRFQRERRALPAVALTTDTSILTAVANDYGYELVFARQVEALARPGDVVVGISTSGSSPNVVAAIERAKAAGAAAVGMTGETGGKLADLCDVCIKVPSNVTARIQEAHILVGHIICEMIDEVPAGV